MSLHIPCFNNQINKNHTNIPTVISTMASSSKTEKARNVFKAKIPHFFKIILQDSIHDSKLGVPKKFATLHGDKLPSSVILKVPTGEKWSVELMKNESGIWFEKGWQEFMEYYALGHGSFLVFQYDNENCNFNVIIFDKSASEIEYPYKKKVEEEKDSSNLGKKTEEQAKTAEDESDDDTSSVEILDEFPQNIREKRSLPSPQPLMKIKVENFTRNSEVYEKRVKKETKEKP